MTASNQTIEQSAGDLVDDEPPSPATEEEFERWAFAHEKVRSEWVEGRVEILAPTTIDHCRTNIFLLCVLGGFIEQRETGQLMGLGYMVRLAKCRSRRLPDLMYVCDNRANLMQEPYFDGPPDLVVEIVSEGTQSRDYRVKYLEYEAAGVREYWIVDPLSQRCEAHRLGDDGKFTAIDEQDCKLTSTVLDGFHLRNEWLWATPRPKVKYVLQEMGIE